MIRKLFAGRGVPLIVATALLMENLDSSVLATSLPQIAADLHQNPIDLKLALTSYLLALAVFIPASGWAADRFGARLVFRAAIVVFTAGSIACGLSSTLPELVLSRVLQGMGGAMMVPVGRLIVLRATPKSDLVGALAWLTVPALLGPVLGPPVGGFITTVFHWRWIFWINLPIAALGLVLATLYIPDVRAERVSRFDTLGFLLLGPGLACAFTGVTLSGIGLAPVAVILALIAIGAALLAFYTRHAFALPDPLIDLRLIRLPSFRIAVAAGTLFRVGSGSTPFLLPLMLQLGFGLSALQSGLLTFATGAGAITMKFTAQPILRRFGFRQSMMINAVIAAGFVGAPAFFTPQTPALVMILVLFVGGISRSLQFTAINAVVYSDVPKDRLSSATSFQSVLQQLASSAGITVAALGLEAAHAMLGGPVLALQHFPYVFCLVAALPFLSAWGFSRLAPDTGAEMLVRPARS